MESDAYGKARLRPDEFYDLTPWQFEMCMVGYTNQQLDQWRIARWQSYIVLASQVGKKAPLPDKILPLPGDKREIELKVSGDDFIGMFIKRYS